MLVLVSDEIEKVSDKLQVYKGWLPFQFLNYINSQERRRFLESIGLDAEVRAKNEEVMLNVRKLGMDSDVYLNKLLKQWIVENPEFSNLIIDV